MGSEMCIRDRVKSVDQSSDDGMSDLVGLVGELLDLLQKQLHELTGRSIHSQDLVNLILLAFFSLDKAQSNLD